jgi:hypothetical protein
MDALLRRPTNKKSGSYNMKYLPIVAAALVAVMGTSTSVAQVTEDSMGKIVPVNLYICDFVGRKGPSDLNKVIANWNAYMDERGNTNYAAWTLAPYHFGGENTFDVAWLGVYTDGNAMGAGTDQWLAEGAELRDQFAEVVECRAHLGMGSAMYKPPADGDTPGTGVITIMDCKLNEGHRYEDIQAAEVKWAEHMTRTGSRAGTYHWFPQYGGGNADFDYKVVQAYASYADLGADWERFANGGGRAASMETFGDIDDCDDARVYIATNRRMAKIR